MSIETTIARITELRSAFAPPATASTATATPTTAMGGTDGTFAGALTAAQSAAGLGANAVAAPAALSGGTVGQRMVAVARAEIGQGEQPPGSNDSTRIAQYRTATQGSGVGPWCAYFVSWVAQQAGSPIGPNGRGEGYVPTVWSWAKQAGRAIPVGQGQPQPGDLIVWGGHIGLVEAVLPGGRVQTIEGNS
jgi:hypothetical protein